MRIRSDNTQSQYIHYYLNRSIRYLIVQNRFISLLSCSYVLTCFKLQVAADMTFSWHRGHEMASLQVPETDVDDEDEEQERTDAALVKHDVIKVINRFSDSFQFTHLLRVQIYIN